MTEIYKKYAKKYGFENAQESSDAFFSGAIKVAVNEYSLSPQFLADEFKVSESTIGRWKTNQSIPVKNARGVILDRLAKILEEK